MTTYAPRCLALAILALSAFALPAAALAQVIESNGIFLPSTQAERDSRGHWVMQVQRRGGGGSRSCTLTGTATYATGGRIEPGPDDVNHRVGGRTVTSRPYVMARFTLASGGTTVTIAPPPRSGITPAQQRSLISATATRLRCRVPRQPGRAQRPAAEETPVHSGDGEESRTGDSPLSY